VGTLQLDQVIPVPSSDPTVKLPFFDPSVKRLMMPSQIT
jgi:hypothetical protein